MMGLKAKRCEIAGSAQKEELSRCTGFSNGNNRKQMVTAQMSK